VDVPVEHRRGPVGVPGGPLWLAGPDQLAAVGATGQRLAVHRVAGPRLGPVALADGGVALVEGAGELVGYRATGAERYRRKLEPADPAQALARLPGGGVAVAFAAEVRGYDADGVPRFTATLPDRGTDRGLALAGDTLWTWSATGAYRISLKGEVLARQPAGAPRTGRVYAAATRDGTLFLLVAEKGFHPVRVAAVDRTDGVAWSRPFTGDPPRDCRLAIGPAGQVAMTCPGHRVVVRDPTGITRYDATNEGPHRAALGPSGQFLVAVEGRDRSLARECRFLHYAPAGDEPRVTTRPGVCPVPWFDAAGRRYAGSAPLSP
jgi:hypothetical protein